MAERLATDFAFSHSSAALLHGCWTWRLGPAVHVTQSGVPKAGRRADPLLRRHCSALPPDSRTTVAGLPVTSLERTVVDSACELDEEQAIVIADSALRLGADPDLIVSMTDARAGYRGIRRARRVLALADGDSESPGETLTRCTVVQAGLPTPRVQIDIHTGRGTLWVDLGWDDIKVGIEFDGVGKYGADGRDARADILAEKKRDGVLDGLGWTIVHVVWADLADRDALVARVRGAIGLGTRRTLLTQGSVPARWLPGASRVA
ncbi:conserved hypothetical protein [Beutenbergia cavernae DSM 12333]|uniref:DUF559 domain-containing protein n=1 Tax=Beutenbergia cavernae (strain ATCC BAA-8 / DSM 12333 / CCUG 43141 / JCM 11478 / NBRC 16432 / NCIMB 13614 / HKI 0122) TaxID=471853 RepID=C5C1Y0_BEUC1|nr:hypothetical protein [Beutenbergia cavernae]ACQ79598.1 conserved hypothetical protein [Beutenbergia cavernae DSM 12333]